MIDLIKFKDIDLKKHILLGMIVTLMLASCTKDDEDIAEFNKPALYWYKKIAKSISMQSMDKADAFYISMKSEHMRSSL